VGGHICHLLRHPLCQPYGIRILKMHMLENSLGELSFCLQCRYGLSYLQRSEIPQGLHSSTLVSKICNRKVWGQPTETHLVSVSYFRKKSVQMSFLFLLLPMRILINTEHCVPAHLIWTLYLNWVMMSLTWKHVPQDPNKRWACPNSIQGFIVLLILSVVVERSPGCMQYCFSAGIHRKTCQLNWFTHVW
jgi:hypothetical protein